MYVDNWHILFDKNNLFLLCVKSLKTYNNNNFEIAAMRKEDNLHSNIHSTNPALYVNASAHLHIRAWYYRYFPAGWYSWIKDSISETNTNSFIILIKTYSHMIHFQNFK